MGASGFSARTWITIRFLQQCRIFEMNSTTYGSSLSNGVSPKHGTRKATAWASCRKRNSVACSLKAELMTRVSCSPSSAARLSVGNSARRSCVEPSVLWILFAAAWPGIKHSPYAKVLFLRSVARLSRHQASGVRQTYQALIASAYATGNEQDLGSA